MGVEAISTQGEFDAAVTGAPCSMLVVVEFSAGWCDSSQRVATELDSLDGAHVTTSGTKWASALASEGMARTRAGIYKGTVGFFRVDVDEGEELTRDASVHVLPTCARAPQRRRHHHRRRERRSPVARPECRCASRASHRFIFVKSGHKVFEMAGSNPTLLRAKVEELVGRPV